MNPLNAQDFGFLPTNNGTDNRIGWATAITAAQAQRKPLYIPAGTYELELTPEEPKGVSLTESVTIFGDGPEHTVIDVYPKIVSFRFTVIWWEVPDLHVTLKGLKVLGPTGTDQSFADLTKECSFMQGITQEPYGCDNLITIDDLVVTGNFVNTIYTANGDGLVEIRNSDITALSVCVAVFETTNSFLNKRFHADNCRFSSGVPAEKTSNGEPFGICVYLHPHIATRVTKCRFYDNPRAAIKQFGVDSVGHAPKYSQYIGCHFSKCSFFTIVTPGEDVVTLIEACTFDDGFIACRNKTNVVGCEFRGKTGIRTTAGHREQQFDVNVVGCWINLSASVIALEDSPGMSLLVRDCVFSFATGSELGTAGVSLGQALYGEVSSSRFVGRTASPPHALAGVKISPYADTRHKVEHCSFAGNFHLAGIAIQPGAELAGAEVNCCDFSQLNGTPIHFNTGSLAYGNVIRGTDNTFNNQAMTTGGYATDLTAHIRPRTGMAPNPVTAVAIPSEAPKCQIILDQSYDTFHVAGSRIDYVHIGSMVERNKFEGPIHLVADSRWRLTSGGNIRPMSFSRRRINEVVTLFLDPARGLWYEE